MRDPVIASIGYVRVELQANRAGFNATFQVVDRSVAEASRKAADQVRALSQTLAAYGVDKVRVETSLTTQPLYDQYRDENGVLRDNTRADRIERYQARRHRQPDGPRRAPAGADLRHRRRLPADVDQPGLFQPRARQCWPSPTWPREAVQDAAQPGPRGRRERRGDPGLGAGDRSHRPGLPDRRPGRLALLWFGRCARRRRWTRSSVTGSARWPRNGPPPPPPPPAPLAARRPSEAQIEAARLALQPPLQVLTDQACVVYGLNG